MKKNKSKMVEQRITDSGLRLALLEVMKDKLSPKRIQKRAEQHYYEIGCGSCDYETIERFIEYRGEK